LPEPYIIPYVKSYDGCKSWIELQRAIALNEGYTVMSEGEYQQQARAIREELGIRD
jgi:hypothetical protein